MPTGVYERTEWHCEINRRAHKGQIPWCAGKKMSKKHREILSEAHKGLKWTEHQRKIMSKKFSGEGNPAWKGGEVISRGYVYVYSPDHPFATKENYVKKSRLIIERQLGRYLKTEEVVHHINGIKDDDRPENLMRFDNQSEHKKYELN